MTNQGAFESAIKNPRERQAFIDSIPLEEAARYVKCVKYKPCGRSLDGSGLLMAVDGSKISLLRSYNLFKGFRRYELKTEVQIFPLAFTGRRLQTYGDFLSSLIDHEGFHAKEFKEGKLNATPNPFSIWSDLKFTIATGENEILSSVLPKIEGEIRACQNQLVNADRRGLSEENRKRLAENIAHYELRRKKLIFKRKTFESM